MSKGLARSHRESMLGVPHSMLGLLACGPGVLLLCLSPTPALAQSGITPLMTGPQALGAGAMQYAGYITIEDEIDLFGVYRQGVGGRIDFGLRLGYTDAGEGGIHLGGDLRYELPASASVEVGFALVGGLQITLADVGNRIAAPFGVAIGRDVGTGERSILLYGLPFLEIDRVDPDFADAETNLELGVELGAELEVSSRWLGQVALVVASHDDDNVSLALGLVYR